jgi:hypothetical protein
MISKYLKISFTFFSGAEDTIQSFMHTRQVLYTEHLKVNLHPGFLRLFLSVCCDPIPQ